MVLHRLAKARGCCNGESLPWGQSGQVHRNGWFGGRCLTPGGNSGDRNSPNPGPGQMGGQLPRLPAFERISDSPGILLVDLLYASGRRCCFGSLVRDRRYDMTLRVEDPEVQTELRNLAHCFRSGRQTLPFSKECTHTPRCADVAVLGGTDEAGAEPYRELEELRRDLDAALGYGRQSPARCGH